MSFTVYVNISHTSYIISLLLYATWEFRMYIISSLRKKYKINSYISIWGKTCFPLTQKTLIPPLDEELPPTPLKCAIQIYIYCILNLDKILTYLGHKSQCVNQTIILKNRYIIRRSFPNLINGPLILYCYYQIISKALGFWYTIKIP